VTPSAASVADAGHLIGSGGSGSGAPAPSLTAAEAAGKHWILSGLTGQHTASPMSHADIAADSQLRTGGGVLRRHAC